MKNNQRVRHERGFSLKYKQALKGINECALAWVERGVSVRDLTLAEAIEARNNRAKLLEPLPVPELHHLVFDHIGAREELRTAWQANRFCEQAGA